MQLENTHSSSHFVFVHSLAPFPSLFQSFQLFSFQARVNIFPLTNSQPEKHTSIPSLSLRPFSCFILSHLPASPLFFFQSRIVLFLFHSAIQRNIHASSHSFFVHSFAPFLSLFQSFQLFSFQSRVLIFNSSKQSARKIYIHPLTQSPSIHLLPFLPFSSLFNSFPSSPGSFISVFHTPSQKTSIHSVTQSSSISWLHSFPFPVSPTPFSFQSRIILCPLPCRLPARHPFMESFILCSLLCALSITFPVFSTPFLPVQGHYFASFKQSARKHAFIQSFSLRHSLASFLSLFQLHCLPFNPG